MTEFTIAIAGVNIQIRTIYPTTKDFCKDYLSEGAADFAVEMMQEDISREKELAAREDALEGLPERNFHDAVLESTAVYRKIVNRLIDYDILLFHGSVVAVDGVAYLFTAKSGTGKSTHTRLWRKIFGDRAVMINDDKPLLKFTDSGVLVCGTPWDGKHHLNTNTMVPLKAICVLERSGENRIEKISASEALPMLMQQSHRPGNILKYMELLDQLTKHVQFHKLQCNMDISAAKLAYEGMQ